MAELGPILYRTPIADQTGLVSRPWQQWFESLLARVGGVGQVPALDETAAASEGNEFNEEHALLVTLARQVADLEHLTFFATPPGPSPRDEALSLFEGVSHAEMAQVKEQIHNLETLSIFAL